jgi:hypothetical protein
MADVEQRVVIQKPISVPHWWVSFLAEMIGLILR